MNRRRGAVSARIAVMAGLLAALVLTACQPERLGAAAIVNGERIAVDDVQASVRAVRELQAQVGQQSQLQEDLARTEVQRRLILAVYERAARELGVTVTPGEVSAELAKARQAAGSEEEFERQLAAQNLSLESAPEYARQLLLARKMAQRLAPASAQGQPEQQAAQDQALTNRLIQTAKRMHFEVNPRYGTFDPNNGQLTPRPEDFIRPVTTPAGNGAAP